MIHETFSFGSRLPHANRSHEQSLRAFEQVFSPYRSYQLNNGAHLSWQAAYEYLFFVGRQQHERRDLSHPVSTEHDPKESSSTYEQEIIERVAIM
jgi:hypothetical protein